MSLNILDYKPPSHEEVSQAATRRQEIIFVVLPSCLFALPLVVLNVGVLSSVSSHLSTMTPTCYRLVDFISFVAAACGAFGAIALLHLTPAKFQALRKIAAILMCTRLYCCV